MPGNTISYMSYQSVVLINDMEDNDSVSVMKRHEKGDVTLPITIRS